MKLKTNENIQYLRGVAALSVVMAHTVSSFTAFRDIGGLGNVVLHNVELLGQVGVGVFFIISGYIMSMTTAGKSGGSSNAKIFLLKRAIRIYPIYFIWTSVNILLWALGVFQRAVHYSPGKIISSYLLIPYISFDGDVIDPILRQGWTLIYEGFYYLSFALLILFGQHKKNGIYILAVFFILLNIFSQFMSSPSAQSFFSGQVIWLFVVGMFIYHHQQQILARMKSRMASIIMMTIFLLSVIIIVFKNHELGGVAEYVHYLSALSFFLCLFSAKKVSGVVLEIGNSSYSLYLTHAFVTTAFAIVVRSGGLSNSTLFMLGIATFFIAIVVGEIAYRLIERKIIYKTAAVAHVSPPLVKP